MKKVNFLTMAAVALMTGFAGCSNDEGTINDESIEKGKPTAMELTITAPRAPQTYAADDPNATDDEIDMISVYVLIYAETSTPGSYILEKNASLVRADFEPALTSPDIYKLKDASRISTTTGNKKIYVAMNYPGTLPALNDPLSNLPALTYTLLAADGLSSNGLAMFSVEEKSATLVVETTPGVTPAANKVQIEVKRMVAKVTVQENIPLTGGKIISQGGELTNLEFAIGNANKSIYAFQKRVGTSPIVVQDPNWSSYASGDFFAVAPASYQSVDAYLTTVLNLKTAYAPENTAQTYNPDGDNLTYISVRATYAPEFFSDATGTNIGPKPAGTPFWTVTTTGGAVMYFESQADATSYQSATPGSSGVSAKYDNGLCYFRAYINKNGVADGNIAGSAAAKFDVLRNNYYKAVINSIKAPGRPVDEGKVTEEAFIIVDIKVEPWHMVDDEYDLI